MTEPRFKHLRDYFLGELQSTGGATVAWKTNAVKQELQFAATRCSNKDVFSKAAGREFATKAFNEGKLVILTLAEIQEIIADWLVPNIVMNRDMVSVIKIENLSRKFIHHLIETHPKLEAILGMR